MTISFDGRRAVSAAEMQAIDKASTERFGIHADTLMENAGVAMAKELAATAKEDTRFLIVCGRGNNGGDGLVIARKLLDAGFETRAFILPPKGETYPPLVQMNLKRALFKHVSVKELHSPGQLAEALKNCDIVVDALLGTGTAGAPSGLLAEAITAINAAAKTVAAADLPSGLNPDTGETCGPCVKAAKTFMLGLPKTGLLNEKARPFTGELKLLNIGFPEELLTGKK